MMLTPALFGVLASVLWVATVVAGVYLLMEYFLGAGLRNGSLCFCTLREGRHYYLLPLLIIEHPYFFATGEPLISRFKVFQMPLSK